MSLKMDTGIKRTPRTVAMDEQIKELAHRFTVREIARTLGISGAQVNLSLRRQDVRPVPRVDPKVLDDDEWELELIKSVLMNRFNRFLAKVWK